MTVSADAAGTWRLGDLAVNRMGLGAMRLTGDQVFSRGRPSDRRRAITVLRTAVELGVNHIDTAAFYFSALRSANELINSALSPYPDGLVIATKVGPGRDPWGEWTDAARPDQLRGQVEENLRQLGRDHLDVVNFRRQSQESVTDHVGALVELRDAGLIRHIGVSAVSADQLRQALAVTPIVAVQNRFAVDRPGDEREIIRLCAEHGIAYVPFFALSGTAGERPRGDDHGDAVSAVAAAHGASTAQVRLAWTLQLSPNVLAIPGTGDPGHLVENVAAAALRLTDEELALLDRS